MIDNRFGIQNLELNSWKDIEFLFKIDEGTLRGESCNELIITMMNHGRYMEGSLSLKQLNKLIDILQKAKEVLEGTPKE